MWKKRGFVSERLCGDVLVAGACASPGGGQLTLPPDLPNMPEKSASKETPADSCTDAVSELMVTFGKGVPVPCCSIAVTRWPVSRGGEGSEKEP